MDNLELLILGLVECLESWIYPQVRSLLVNHFAKGESAVHLENVEATLENARLLFWKGPLTSTGTFRSSSCP